MVNIRFPAVAGTLLVIALVARASAADAPDPNTQREFGAKLQVCGACHGNDGVPKGPSIPIIWGQQESYLEKQLHDFQIGNRNQEVMNWMAGTLTGEEVKPSTVVFASRKWPVQARPAAAVAPPPGMAVCQACHQANFMGAAQNEGAPTPRLAGQSYEYLISAMNRFANGERTNNADMVQIMKGISPANRDAMARYLSSL
ncbi:MAG TPA: c-type cytochrome [Micropepsaceae bacterium]|nr:c-type cytochrome [Micropepsaceae bacterium]